MLDLARSDIEDLGERIFRLRDERGWSQTELARRAGVSRTTLSHLEAGVTRSPSSPTLRRLARALDVTVYGLVGGELTTKKT